MRVASLPAIVLMGACCAGCVDFGLFPAQQTQVHNSSSLVQFLYPRGASPPAQDQVPQLRLPLRIGLSFLPPTAGTEFSSLDAARREALLERIREHFRRRPFVADISLIPDYYLASERGFQALQAVQRLYGVDLIALVSYDQVTHEQQNQWSLTYWTIVGSYFVRGERHDISTLVDLAVVDPQTRSLVLRAGGTATNHGNSTPMGERRDAREDSAKGFDAATAQMIDHMDAALVAFESEVRAGRAAVRVVHRTPFAGAGGGGGSIGYAELAVLLGLSALRLCSRIRRGGALVAALGSALACVILLGSHAARAADLYDARAEEPAAASLAPDQITGTDFRVLSPVHCDGLMHRYVIETPYGTFSAYGPLALRTRLQEISAFGTIARTSDAEVVLRSVTRGVQEDAGDALTIATHPVDTVTGIPRGIAHLFGGYWAQAQEVSGEARRVLAGAGSDSRSAEGSGGFGRIAQVQHAAGAAAQRYTDQYLGLSAAERRWYQRLRVDPYTTNSVLRRAVQRLARVDAAASFGMRFAPVGVPFAGEVHRALDAIYHEDPAMLRKRRHEALARLGLTPPQIERFENTLLLTPTRQSELIDAAQSLTGVQGREELLRHASAVTSEEEIEVFLDSTRMLLRYHAQHPLLRVMAGVRLPAAQRADGAIVLFGEFDDVQWTPAVAGYEQALREALPPAAPRELRLAGAVSERARAALQARGWAVADHADP